MKKIENLEVVDIAFRDDAMLISWTANIGFGQYWVGVDEFGQWEADSECLDKGNDKAFLAQLLEKAAEYIVKRVLIIG